jgi:hypothetical protein
MVNVTNRSDVTVRLRPLKFFLRHSLSLIELNSYAFTVKIMAVSSPKRRKEQAKNSVSDGKVCQAGMP